MLLIAVKMVEGMVYMPAEYVKVQKIDDDRIRIKAYQTGKEPILTDISKQAGNTATIIYGEGKSFVL